MTISIEMFYSQLDQLFQVGSGEEIEGYLKGVLRNAESTQDDALMLACANELSGFYRASARFEDGMEVIGKALCAVKRLGLHHSKQHATTLLNRATLQSAAGDYSESAASYEEALRIYQTLGLESSYEVVALYNNSVSVYLALGELDKAECNVNKALELMPPEKIDEVAVTTSVLGRIYMARGNHAAAEEKFSTALSLLRENGLSKTLHYASILSAQGSNFYSIADYSAAESCFIDAGIIIEKLYGKGPLYQKNEHNLMLCREKQCGSFES